ncbi:mannose-1-phosphate guanylyltransferase [Haloplanus aerogenes]|uniref:Mannose-1-phosphate guanylyltransferase n=1 Tax=Haloplanus aerogenes TaxID=660522 RepID=A0A3M0DPD5_9EURY|nr:sugar phosphate nucleotidyltransferase [Haloplanus aerogenes]RMB23652.1 mannose-1-phosphate guanylyltransferase [Haloplanus aerogenes]
MVSAVPDTDRPLVATVLAGGIGSRLYPASRSHRPKQLLSLAGEDTLLERTVDRVAFADAVVVVTRPAFVDAVRETVPEASVLVEPAGKDTGPALAYATHRIEERFDDPVVLALPSDHYVDGDFEPTARRGARVAAETDALVTFGVEPDRPETGYGYIEPGSDHGDYAEVAAFHEKPDAETAESYVARGYYWNAGIFTWTPRAFREAAEGTPLGPLLDALDAGDADGGFDAVDPVSVDYAVLERATDVVTVPLDVAWDDLGSWDALQRLLPADEDGTVVAGDAEVVSVDAENNVVASDDVHVSLVGVEGLAVVAYDDRVLVVPTEEAQRVRDLVATLKERGEF